MGEIVTLTAEDGYKRSPDIAQLRKERRGAAS